MKKLGAFSLIMINIIATGGIRVLPFGATNGYAVITFYLVAACLFFIPYALATTELVTTLPEKGGLYVWVRAAFGTRVSTLLVWFQWIYNLIWFPTILLLIVSVAADMINPSLSTHRDLMVCCILILFWAITLLNCFGMQLSGLISEVGALFGVLIPMLLIIILTGVWLFKGYPLAIHFSWSQLLPNTHQSHNLAFFSAIVFGLISLDLSTIHADSAKNPRRTYPKVMCYSAILILLVLTLSSLGLALVVPSKQLNLVTGSIQAFHIFFTQFHLSAYSYLIDLFIIIGGLGAVSSWVLGPAKSLSVAGHDAILPKILTHENRQGAPVAALLLQAIFFTLLCAVFFLLPNLMSGYWLFTALTAQLSMVVYCGLFAALWKLRQQPPNQEKHFVIPGKKLGLIITVALGLSGCLLTIISGFIPPELIGKAHIMRYEVLLCIGLGVFTLLPVLLMTIRSDNENSSNRS